MYEGRFNKYFFPNSLSLGVMFDSAGALIIYIPHKMKKDRLTFFLELIPLSVNY